YALTHLVGQAVMSVWYAVYYSIAPNVPFFMQIVLIYVMNLVCLSGPVCLFVTRQVHLEKGKNEHSTLVP
ncbi:hypothetical protein AAVH_09130, partial [Aphelenchoides avenae]